MPKHQGPSGVPDDLRAAIGEWEDLQDEYTDAGAGDTEPDGVFHGVIRRAVLGKPQPWDTLDWQLFDSEPDDPDNPEERRTYERALEAVPKLTAAAKKVDELVRKYADSRKVVDALRGYCWRTSF